MFAKELLRHKLGLNESKIFLNSKQSHLEFFDNTIGYILRFKRVSKNSEFTILNKICKNFGMLNLLLKVI